jgi:hypothetical protein
MTSAGVKKSRPWLRQIVRWLNGCESKLPEPAFLRGDFPEWVQRLSRELLATLFPKAKLKVNRYWAPAEVGAILGHQLAYCAAIGEMPVLPVHRAFRVDKKALARAKKQVRRFMECYIVAVQRSVALASVQRYPEATEFFTAFANGLNKKPVDADATNFQRTTTKVYWIMLLGWRSVQKLRSVRELQQGLCKYLEPHVVGDIKRIEKICQRLGLTFGPRGRPRKIEIQTKRV